MEYAPAAVVVNSRGEVLYLHGHTQPGRIIVAMEEVKREDVVQVHAEGE